jgi:hypothetical protein
MKSGRSMQPLAGRDPERSVGTHLPWALYCPWPWHHHLERPRPTWGKPGCVTTSNTSLTWQWSGLVGRNLWWPHRHSPGRTRLADKVRPGTGEVYPQSACPRWTVGLQGSGLQSGETLWRWDFRAFLCEEVRLAGGEEGSPFPSGETPEQRPGNEPGRTTGLGIHSWPTGGRHRGVECRRHVQRTKLKTFKEEIFLSDYNLP